MAERRKIGPVERAVRRDLKALDIPPGREVLEQLAYMLARALDARDVEKGGAAMTTQLARELRTTMVTLTGGIDNDDAAAALRAFTASLSTPVGDTADPGKGDAGPARGQHLRSVG
jgi:TPP-dependent trihydroxycyclohexane-1,2-dione (THcHDO) dehydratase